MSTMTKAQSAADLRAERAHLESARRVLETLAEVRRIGGRVDARAGARAVGSSERSNPLAGITMEYDGEIRGLSGVAHADELPARLAAIEQRVAEIDAALPEAEERDARADVEREEQESAEQQRRMRTAMERARAAAQDARRAEEALDAAYAELDELIAASPIGRILDAQGERQVAGTAFHAAMVVLGKVALHGDGITDTHRALLEQLGPDANAARRALHVDHPARLHTEPRRLRYAALMQHLLNPPTHGGA